MSGKKKPAGKQIALCLLLTAAVDGLGVLLVTLLAVKGIVGEDRVPQALGALAFCAAFAGGLPAGKGRLGPGGSLLNAGAFALLLLLLCFGGWGEGIAVRGLILLALILLGGLLVFLFVRRFGVKAVEVFFPREKIESLRFLHNEKRLALWVFILFFIPGTPKDIMTYIVPLTPMKLSTFLLLSTVARLPSVVTSTTLGPTLLAISVTESASAVLAVPPAALPVPDEAAGA